jgi:hypothetical protein
LSLGKNFLSGKRLQEILRRHICFRRIASVAAGDEVGGRVGAAAGDGEDVVERPVAGAEGASAIEAAATIAQENARAKVIVAEMVGTRPGAGLAGGVAVGLVRDQSKLLGNRSPHGARGNLVGKKHFETTTAPAAVENAHALFADEYAEIVPRGVRRKARNARGLTARDGEETPSGEARAADEMVIERALVGAEAKRGNEPVLNGGPNPSGREALGHGEEVISIQGQTANGAIHGPRPGKQDETRTYAAAPGYILQLTTISIL